MFNEKLLIIPDVHGRPFWREAVSAHKGMETIFLGDYLDPYEDEGISEEEAFEGLKDIIRFKEDHPDTVTLLWGNHDLHYLYPELIGSRYDIEHAERNAHYFWDHQNLFKMAYETTAGGKRFLFSHAGVGLSWIQYNFPTLPKEEITAELLNDLVGYPDFMSALGDISMYRGGDKPFGSMIWADIMEHGAKSNHLEGVVQVFGHTQVNRPLNYRNEFFCLDCKQAFIFIHSAGTISDATTMNIIKAKW